LQWTDEKIEIKRERILDSPIAVLLNYENQELANSQVQITKI
jgi:hypothetical protein